MLSPVPRKNPFPKREKEICNRLLKARQALDFTRVSLARRTAIDAGRLANYELGKAAVPFGVAMKISCVTRLSFRWLATGEGSQLMDEKASYPQIFLDLIPARLPLSVAYDRLLARIPITGIQGHDILQEIPELKSLKRPPASWMKIGGCFLPWPRRWWLEEELRKGDELPSPIREMFYEQMAFKAQWFFKHKYGKEIRAMAGGEDIFLKHQREKLSAYIVQRLKDSK